MTAKSNLKNLIQSSYLKASEKNLWYGFIDEMDDGELQVIFQAAKEHKYNLIFLTKNLKSKVRILSGYGRIDDADVAENEKVYLLSLD